MNRTLLIACALLLAVPSSADVGRIKSVAGEAFVERGSERLPATPGIVLESADTLVTGPDGKLGITFSDNSRFALGPNTRIQVEGFEFNTTTHEGRFRTRMEQGTLSVVSGKIAKRTPDAMQVRTPSSILGVRGTEFLVKVEP